MNGGWTDLLKGRSRRNRAYAKHKLTFFERYFPSAFKVARGKLTRHYVDLFAGPGVWHDPDGGRHLGSPLKALALSAHAGPGNGFTEAFFVNRNGEDHEALASRIELMVERGMTDLAQDRIHLIHGDANEELAAATSTSSSRSTWRCSVSSGTRSNTPTP